VYRAKKPKRDQGPTKGYTAIDRVIDSEIVYKSSNWRRRRRGRKRRRIL
jgi:hypothetical protein